MLKKCLCALFAALLTTSLGIAVSADPLRTATRDEKMVPITRTFLFTSPQDPMFRRGYTLVGDTYEIFDGIETFSTVRSTVKKGRLGSLSISEEYGDIGHFFDGSFNYFYFPDTKTYSKERSTDHRMVDLFDATMIGSGNAVFDGKSRYYESYAAPGYIEVRIYLEPDKDTVYAMTHTLEDGVFITRNMKYTLVADNSLLKVPDGYVFIPTPLPGVVMPTDININIPKKYPVSTPS